MDKLGNRKDWQEIVARIEKMREESLKKPDYTPESEGVCPLCKGKGFHWINDWTIKDCSCERSRIINLNMQGALIPEDFEHCTMDNYVTNGHVSRKFLFDTAREYLDEFERNRFEKCNSMGMMAIVGESTILATRDANKRATMKQKHNSWGLGKSHLQIAIGKELIQRGRTVLIVRDVPFMNELAIARNKDDHGETFNRLLRKAIEADVLIWDDLGKKAPTDFRRETYFDIFDARNGQKKGKPILFTSNEDKETLSDRIGPAAASRLYGMCGDRLLQVEGPDYRITG